MILLIFLHNISEISELYQESVFFVQKPEITRHEFNISMKHLKASNYCNVLKSNSVNFPKCLKIYKNNPTFQNFLRL